MERSAEPRPNDRQSNADAEFASRVMAKTTTVRKMHDNQSQFDDSHGTLRGGWGLRFVAAAALALFALSAPACSKSSKDTDDSAKAEKKADESGEASNAESDTTASADAGAPSEGGGAGDLEERKRRAAKARAAREEALPRVLSVEDHHRRVDREITKDNYKAELEALEAEVKEMESGVGRRPAPPQPR